MDRITQWVSSQEIPADLTIRIADSIFPLHKSVMVPRCGHQGPLRRRRARPLRAAGRRRRVREGGPLLLRRQLRDHRAQRRRAPLRRGVPRHAAPSGPGPPRRGVPRAGGPPRAAERGDRAAFLRGAPPGGRGARRRASRRGRRRAQDLQRGPVPDQVAAGVVDDRARGALTGVVPEGRHGASVPPRRPRGARQRGERLRGARAGRGPRRPPGQGGPARASRVRNTDTVRRVVAAFVERQAALESGQSRRSSLSGAEADSGAAMEKVAKTVDELAAEIATEESLAISKFVGVAGAVPKDARASHDCLYRAVDTYLKTHPALDEIEREKVCSIMDPLKLSYQARLHASQNKRLPLQAVLSALYYDQLKLRSAAAAAGGAGDDWWDTQSAAGKARAQARADASLARENEALRSELARVRAYVSGMQPSKGSGSSPVSPAAKKASFLGSVSRTLSRLNPFKGGWAKDTASIADGRHSSNTMHVVKPKRRRFSIG